MIEERLVALLAEAIAKAAPALGAATPLPVPELQRPRQKGFGDFTTNVAMVIASNAGVDPRATAAAIVEAMPSARFLAKAEVAGPGFINLWTTDDWLHDVVRRIVGEGGRYGAGAPTGRRIQVEFVSANPTGPLTIGHARNAAIGDALARLLTFAGHEVEREYYFNDAGGQMDRFGASVEARYLEAVGRDAELPEDGYHGEYVADLARESLASEGPGLADLPEEERFIRLREEGAGIAMEQIRATLARFGVTFDTYFLEVSLVERGEIAQAIERLRAAGFVYDGEGATWFRSTAFGDDKDRPAIRTDGTHTYFAADIAYVLDKFSRGFDHLIYVWGADHHGHIARVKGAASALGFDPERVEILLYQFVSFLRGGEPVKMSKRAGTFVSLDELIDEVGADAARFHLLLFSNDRPMNFDIAEVARQTLENPVYYVQYGHARIASILRKASDEGMELRPIEEADLTLLATEPEQDLMRALADIPGTIEIAAEHRAPHRLTHAAQDLAATFHRFYTECRVVSDDDPLTQARLWLSSATKQVLGTLLDLVGVSAPERMDRLEDAEDPIAVRTMTAEGVDPDALEIRRARPTDASAFLTFWKAIVAEERFVRTEEVRTSVRAYRRRFRGRSELETDIVAVDGSRLVGHVTVQRERHPVTHHVASLSIAVAADARGRGIGRRLMDEAIAWSTRAGVEKIVLSVYPHNEAAIGLYRSFGFVEEGRLARHSRKSYGYEDEILMAAWIGGDG